MSPVNDPSGKPTYWRSFAELENTPEFREFVEREFATPLETEPANSPGRRRFMQLMGASFALAGVGCRYERDKILPHTRRPEGEVPGEASAYANAGGASIPVPMFRSSQTGVFAKAGNESTHATRTTSSWGRSRSS